MEILTSKLQFPKVSDVLHRERLVRKLSGIENKVLAIVTAGAGYGKTTLVIDALSRMDMDIVWYRLDPQDMDFMVFMAYLERGALNSCPQKKGSAKDRLKTPQAILLEWIKNIETHVKKATVIVVDDFHLVQENTDITDALEFILERLPRHLHLVVVSRKDPPLRLSKYRVAGQLVEINETDLFFTPLETNTFFSQIHHLAVSADQTHEIHEKTGGWAASLVLFNYALKGKTADEIDHCIAQFKGSQKYVFSYLEENVFEAQPPEIQDFMLKSALFSEIHINLCNRIFQICTAKNIIQKMMADHLLIFPVSDDGTVFYYHHLLQDFLVEKLYQTYAPDQIDLLHQTIAVAIEDTDVFQAIHHYIHGRAFEAAARLMEANEIRFLLEGKVHFIGKCLKKIPDGLIEKNPRLLLAQAKIYSYYGNPQEALSKLKAALMLFKKVHSDEDSMKCLIEIGTQYYCTGHVKEAKLLMEQVLCEVDEFSSTYIIAMTYLIFLAAVLGKFDNASAYYGQAREVIRGYPEFERQVGQVLIDTSHTYQYYIEGDFHRSHRLNQKLLKITLDLNLESVLPLVYYQCAATCCSLGQFDEGAAFARKGVDICEKIELKDSKTGWVLIAYAQNCIGLGRFEQAMDLLNQSSDIFEAPGNRWGLANAWHVMHKIYLEKGKTEQAMAILIRARDVIDSHGLVITEGIVENSMARVLICERNFTGALDCLNKSRPKLKHTAFYLFENFILTSQCYLGQNLLKSAIKPFIQAVELSMKKEYDRFLENQEAIIRPLLGTQKLTTAVRQYLYACLGSMPDADPDPEALSLQLFGRFKAVISSRELDSGKWNSSKALMILKYLAAHGDRGFIPREVLIELLWPDQDMDKTAKRFNMAMSALRKTLEPGIAPRASSTYILRKKDTYRLRQDNTVTIDRDVFLSRFNAAQKLMGTDPDQAMKAFLIAESQYTGPFLEEDLYEEWCIRERDRLGLVYLEILKAVLHCCEIRKDIENGVFYAKKILAEDSCDEDILKKLMGFYADIGDIVNMKKAYDTYKQCTIEMDCPVNPAITDYFNTLIQKQAKASKI